MKSIKSFFPLIIGVCIGAVAAILFSKSMPPPEGSPQERIMELEAKNVTLENKLKVYEDTTPRRGLHDIKDGMKSIAERLRAGETVTPDDIFRASKPLLQDISPITERVQLVNMRRKAQSIAGNYARKYHLTKEQEKGLEDCLYANAEMNVKKQQTALDSPYSTLKDYASSQRELENSNNGLDQYMSNTLQGNDLANFRVERLNEKAKLVQGEADRKVNRINSIVELDSAQRSQMFLHIAQNSKNYDPQMQFDDVDPTAKNLPTGMNEKKAINAILRPEQQEVYRQYTEQKHQLAELEAKQYGLNLSYDWNPLEEDDF